jgi:hypothetical protein
MNAVANKSPDVDATTIMQVSAEHATASSPHPDHAQTIRRIRRLCYLLDSAFAIPGTNIRVGLDPIIGLIPGAGDVITAILALYIVVLAGRIGVRSSTMARMLANVAIDFLGGSIPIVGDIFDVAWKCNLRNLVLLERELGIT